MSPTPRSLGEQAREQRRAMRLTQADVADLSMVSERFIREFVQGKRSVRLDKVEPCWLCLAWMWWRYSTFRRHSDSEAQFCSQNR